MATPDGKKPKEEEEFVKYQFGAKHTKYRQQFMSSFAACGLLH